MPNLWFVNPGREEKQREEELRALRKEQKKPIEEIKSTNPLEALLRSNTFHISVISCEEKIVWISPLCFEWGGGGAEQERQADRDHAG